MMISIMLFVCLHTFCTTYTVCVFINKFFQASFWEKFKFILLPPNRIFIIKFDRELLSSGLIAGREHWSTQEQELYIICWSLYKILVSTLPRTFPQHFNSLCIFIILCFKVFWFSSSEFKQRENNTR